MTASGDDREPPRPDPGRGDKFYCVVEASWFEPLRPRHGQASDDAGGGRDRALGCLLGGAVGDALGAPVEFLSLDTIVATHGEAGIAAWPPDTGGRITDDTQMTLFTAEGLITGWRDGGGEEGLLRAVDRALLRWLLTQGEPLPDGADACESESILLAEPALHARRAPGTTCLSALRTRRAPGAGAVNDSKGCGGVMRVAPVGILAARAGLEPAATFRLAARAAGLTHGHPTGQLAAGALAVAVQRLVGGATIASALDEAMHELAAVPGHAETLHALDEARRLAASGRPAGQCIRALGQGWVAEEALAIAAWSALVAPSFDEGVRLAVNHDGDSDSTGAIAGNLLGAALGAGAISAHWLETLELRAVIERMAAALWEVAA